VFAFVWGLGVHLSFINQIFWKYFSLLLRIILELNNVETKTIVFTL